MLAPIKHNFSHTHTVRTHQKEEEDGEESEVMVPINNRFSALYTTVEQSPDLHYIAVHIAMSPPLTYPN